MVVDKTREFPIMGLMKRIYETLIADNLSRSRQMALISGPRQVGKTTTAKQVLPRAAYLNYDINKDALAIRGGAEKIAQVVDLANPLKAKNGIIFDEVHKFPKWKKFLKGFFDSYADNKIRVAVTGSARMDIYKRGGDSLMGRYFMYRIHPLSAREAVSSKVDIEKIFQAPAKISNRQIEKLLEFGGYPEPYLNANKRFYNNWKNLRLEQLFREDLRDLSRVQDIKGVRALSELLEGWVSSGINYSSLGNELGVASDTAKAWINILESVYYCYSIRPWFKNIANSIRKQPKVYLWDWSLIRDEGARNENFVASHLLKAAHWWTDCGLGLFDLFYLRDKLQREVDFLLTKDSKPFMLIEVKSSEKDPLNPHLRLFQKTLKVPYAFQVAFDMSVSEIMPTDYGTPIKISAADLLKILV